MRLRKITLYLSLGLVLVANLSAAKKKKPEVTQVLELPKDPPSVAFGDSARLVFHVSPLSSTGLLSAQTREALKAILRMNGGATVIHIRAFVAGSGDVRRVPQIVSEVFSGKRMPLPSVSVIQAGALPMQNAQIVIEAISETRSSVKEKIVPAGIIFLPVQDSFEQLATVAGDAKVVQVSCFVSQLSMPQELLATLAARFPAAAVDLVQMQRNPMKDSTKCEGIARTGNAGRFAFTGTRLAIGGEEADIKLAFTRLYKDLKDAGVAPEGIVATHLYPISPAVGIVVKALLDIPGTMNLIPFEGLASIDASLAVDTVALAK